MVKKLTLLLIMVALGIFSCSGENDIQTNDAISGDSSTVQDTLDTSDQTPDKKEETKVTGEETKEVKETVKHDTFDPDIEPPTDITPPDIHVDNTPPKVIKISPANGQDNVDIPFKVEITFSEPMKNIGKSSFIVKDFLGNQLEGEIKSNGDDTVFTFVPNGPFFIASPYTVTLIGSIIQDKAGNKLGDWPKITFYTRPPENMEKYKKLAEKYAPIINQETDPNFPQYDYLTSIDFDKNWDGTDNFKHISSSIDKVPSYIYYDVVETLSHYFITYMFYHPFRNTEDPSKQFVNDAAGAMVVVRKYPEEEPIAVETYFKTEEVEQSHAFVTEESGIVPEGENPFQYAYVNKVFPKDELFPNNHFVSYISSKKHESCLWNWEGEEGMIPNVILFCDLPVGKKQTMKKIQYIYKNGQVDDIIKVQGKFPAAKEDVGYGLLSIIVKLWPRRYEVNLFKDTYKLYQPVKDENGKDRPGKGIKLSTAFVTPKEGDYGKPPWSWQWKPGSGSFYELPMGMWFLDPAWYFAKRHKIKIEFNKDTKEGYSAEYCLNPYFNLDQRKTNPLCMDEQQ